jgi:hypothetical protein
MNRGMTAAYAWSTLWSGPYTLKNRNGSTGTWKVAE